MSKIFTINAERSCNGCTACCEGWLSGEAYGFEFSPGVKCKFLSHKSCSIYEVRPYSPCKTFRCYWKINSNVPEEMRPDKSGVIILQKYLKPYHYLRFVRTGKVTQPYVYEWAKDFSKTGGHSVIYEDFEHVVFSESQDFKKVFEQYLKK